MIRADARARRVAIVADYVVNPGSAFYASMPGRVGPALDVLVEDGWGIMKPPPHVLGEPVGRPAVEVMAGDAVDYRRHGYDVVIVAVSGLAQGGVWLDLFAAAFRDLGEPMPRVIRLGLDAGSRPDAAAAVRAHLGSGQIGGGQP